MSRGFKIVKRALVTAHVTALPTLTRAEIMRIDRNWECDSPDATQRLRICNRHAFEHRRTAQRFAHRRSVSKFGSESPDRNRDDAMALVSHCSGCGELPTQRWRWNGRCRPSARYSIGSHRRPGITHTDARRAIRFPGSWGPMPGCAPALPCAHPGTLMRRAPAAGAVVAGASAQSLAASESCGHHGRSVTVRRASSRCQMARMESRRPRRPSWPPHPMALGPAEGPDVGLVLELATLVCASDARGWILRVGARASASSLRVSRQAAAATVALANRRVFA